MKHLILLGSQLAFLTCMDVTYVLAKDPILVAHRGLLRHAPENTLPAFSTCIDLGIGIELDIRTTKDHKLVVLHDDSLQRTTNGPNRSVREFTLAEIKDLDAGKWFDNDFQGVRVPTLEETLAMIKQRVRGPTILALNIKDVGLEGEKELIAMIEKYGLLDESFAFDQSTEASRRMKQIQPRFRLGQNINRQSVDARLQERLLDVFLVTFVPTVNEVEILHNQGKQVIYNFGGDDASRNNPRVWSEAKASGLDGILTDFPLECRLHWRLERDNSSIRKETKE